jgi:hypothetical protein
LGDRNPQDTLMSDRQLDLFSASGIRPDDRAATPIERDRLVPSGLDEPTLIAAIPEASLADCHALSTEAGRRRLIAAIPALEALCRRFKGFGLEHPVPEQIAALRALAMIGTRDGVAAVTRIMADSVVQGPGLRDAVSAAAHLGCSLPPTVALALLRHDDVRVRAAACRCARPHADVIQLLIELLDDLNGPVATAAACALGRAGGIEARPALARLLHEEPTIEVIDAIAPVADENCAVQLGRIARTMPALSAAAVDALDAIDSPRAKLVVSAIRGLQSSEHTAAPEG